MIVIVRPDPSRPLTGTTPSQVIQDDHEPTSTAWKIGFTNGYDRGVKWGMALAGKEVEHLKGQLEIVIAARDLAERRLARCAKGFEQAGRSLETEETKIQHLKNQNEALRQELAKRDKAYEEQVEKLTDSYEEKISNIREALAQGLLSLERNP